MYQPEVSLSNFRDAQIMSAPGPVRRTTSATDLHRANSAHGATDHPSGHYMPYNSAFAAVFSQQAVLAAAAAGGGSMPIHGCHSLQPHYHHYHHQQQRLRQQLHARLRKPPTGQASSEHCMAQPGCQLKPQHKRQAPHHHCFGQHTGPCLMLTDEQHEAVPCGIAAAAGAFVQHHGASYGLHAQQQQPMHRSTLHTVHSGPPAYWGESASHDADDTTQAAQRSREPLCASSLSGAVEAAPLSGPRSCPHFELYSQHHLQHMAAAVGAVVGGTAQAVPAVKLVGAHSYSDYYMQHQQAILHLHRYQQQQHSSDFADKPAAATLATQQSLTLQRQQPGGNAAADGKQMDQMDLQPVPFGLPFIRLRCAAEVSKPSVPDALKAEPGLQVRDCEAAAAQTKPPASKAAVLAAVEASRQARLAAAAAAAATGRDLVTTASMQHPHQPVTRLNIQDQGLDTPVSQPPLSQHELQQLLQHQLKSLLPPAAAGVPASAATGPGAAGVGREQHNSGGAAVSQQISFQDPATLLEVLRHSGMCRVAEHACAIGQRCTWAKRLWIHMHACRSGTCTSVHCLIGKKVLPHYKECVSASCSTCVRVRGYDQALQELCALAARRDSPADESVDSQGTVDSTPSTVLIADEAYRATAARADAMAMSPALSVTSKPVNRSTSF